MNLWYRFILFIMAILFIFTSLLLSLYCFGLAEPEMIPELVFSLYQQWELGILFFIAFIAGCWVIYPFFSRVKNTTLINRSELGEVEITLEALDNLVNTIALEQDGIVAISNRLSTEDDGLTIYLKAKILPSKTIPEITNSLQELVKSYIEDTTGVTVSSIKVLVEDVSDGSKESIE